ncbi:MAG: hypothetical protein L0Z70_16860 [Chloroflexi bacterium]|nr:hypothetical protein [Chloroflexota bacterium]
MLTKAPRSLNLPLSLALFVLAAALAGCNLPGKQSTPSSLNVTQAYETISARLTQAATLTPQPAQTETPTPLPTLTAAFSPSATNLPSTPIPATATPKNTCDQAAPGTPFDVSIPDATVMRGGQSFTKTWRIQNTGTCAWTRAYAVVFFSGDQMGAPVSVSLAGDVAPGHSVDISVDMVAPAAAGKYQGNWKLRNAANVLFGIGPNGSAPFWVSIVVAQTPTPTVTARTATPTATPTITLTPPPQASGTVGLAVGDTLDLDVIQKNSSGADLTYSSNADGNHPLTPQGSAQIALYGANQPSLAQCQAAALGTAGVVVESVPLNSYFCYRTDQGRYGRARQTAFNMDTYQLTLEVVTWLLP